MYRHAHSFNIPVIIERPAAFMHGERYFVVRHEGERVWQLARASKLEPRQLACPRCDAVFYSADPRKMYCSRRCARAAATAAWRERQVAS